MAAQCEMSEPVQHQETGRSAIDGRDRMNKGLGDALVGEHCLSPMPRPRTRSGASEAQAKAQTPRRDCSCITIRQQEPSAMTKANAHAAIPIAIRAAAILRGARGVPQKDRVA
jgi:hypothetical protein